MNSEVNNPFSGLLKFSNWANVVESREKVDNFKNFVRKSKISHHVVNDLLNFCTIMEERECKVDIEEECIVPIIKFFLDDANQEVSKTAYSLLAILINRGKISKKSLENHFCCCLAKVLNHDAFDDDFRLQTINTIFELIFHIDKEVIVREIIPEITKLCLNANTESTLKTACVSRLDKLASKLERELTEKNIIPLYEKMANDKYKIRKNCVEVSVALSYICSKEVREETLVPIYIGFLKDPVKYVSDLALIALGPFIASFANSEQSEHQEIFNEVLVNNIYNFNYGKINIDFNLTGGDFLDHYDYGAFTGSDDYKKLSDYFFSGYDYNTKMTKPLSNKDIKMYFPSVSDNLDSNTNDDEHDEDDELEEEFNSFHFWREPIMSIEELDGNDEKSSEQDKDDECMEIEAGYSNHFSMANRFDLDAMYRLEKEDLLVANIERCLKLLKDTIVPKELQLSSFNFKS